MKDSAGVRIIAYGGEMFAPTEWTTGDPVLVLGGPRAEGAEQFWNVAGTILLNRETIVVGDGGSSELRFFDLRTGAHLRTVGGEGEGPGEIDRLWNLWQAGRLLVAVDASGAASTFDAEGQFDRRIPTPVSDAGRRLRRSGFFGDGSGLAYEVEPGGQVENGRTLDSMRVVELRNDQPSLRAQYPFGILTRPNGARPFPLVFGPVATSIALGDHFCVGFPADYVIDCFSQAGSHLYRFSREEWEREVVDAEHRRDFFARNEAANPPPRGTEYIQFIKEHAEFADHLPAFGRFVGGSAGELWVGPFVPRGDTPVLKRFPREATTWSVYSQEGMWLANVDLPPRFRLMAVGDSVVLGVARDQDDVESVVVLPLHGS